MEIVWQDRKRPFLGLPLSFTKYMLSEKSLLIKTGILNIKEDEVRLYRIIDITLTRSLGQRLLGTGTIECVSSDETMKKFEIKHIKRPRQVKEMLSEFVEEQRRANRVFSRETLAAEGGHDCDHCDEELGEEV